MVKIGEAIDRILARHAEVPENRSLLVGISGIDGSGKGYVAGQIEAHLGQYGVPAAIVNVDGWLNLPEERFSSTAPAEHFYEHAIRFEEFFSQLVLPLRDHRSLHLVADFADETAPSFRKHTYDFKDVGVVVVEGIFLFKPQYRQFFDLAIWTECSFHTALARAISRGQEGLSTAKTIAAYETIYFPAQRIHFAQDKPRENADLILDNDVYSGRDSASTFRRVPKSHSHTASADQESRVDETV
jgi:uridine kinase